MVAGNCRRTTYSRRLRQGGVLKIVCSRHEARRVLGEVGADLVADKIAHRRAITVTELCLQFLADVKGGRLLTRRKIAKKQVHADLRSCRIDRHIIPSLWVNAQSRRSAGRC